MVTSTTSISGIDYEDIDKYTSHIYILQHGVGGHDHEEYKQTQRPHTFYGQTSWS